MIKGKWRKVSDCFGVTFKSPEMHSTKENSSPLPGWEAAAHSPRLLSSCAVSYLPESFHRSSPPCRNISLSSNPWVLPIATPWKVGTLQHRQNTGTNVPWMCPHVCPMATEAWSLCPAAGSARNISGVLGDTALGRFLPYSCAAHTLSSLHPFPPAHLLHPL